uniref:Uncharacterized protein n=1 Tax=Arundo donax TaxID=35708 RepID=A0A0A8XYI3_ARUDO
MGSGRRMDDIAAGSELRAKAARNRRRRWRRRMAGGRGGHGV